MFKLLNRFAWFISLSMGFIIAFSFIGSINYRIGDDEIILSVIFGLFAGLIFKKVFLSINFIEERVSFFAEQLGKINIKEEENNLVLNNLKTSKQDLAKEKEIESFILNNEKKVINDIKTEKVIKEKQIDTIEEPSKLGLAIKKFFSENLLAKLGGILVFLGVLFFLSLIYTAIGPVGKLIIGFAVGFSIFGAGVWLDKKGLENESRILLGIAILINYLVILSGRYLIGGDNSVDDSILTVGTTFLFLIFNTVFAVVTSLVYKSRTLLLFSFVFAFINPLLIGGSSDNPYTLVGYSLIVAFGGLFLALKQKDSLFTTLVFILGNILILLSTSNSDLHWIVKLIASTALSISTIFSIYKIDSKKLISTFFISYIFLILILGTGGVFIEETTSFISYMISIVLFFGIGIYFFLKTAFTGLIHLLLFPILIIIGLTYSGAIFSVSLALAIIVLLYLFGFSKVQSKLPNFLKYIFFGILGIYIFLTNSYLSLSSASNILELSNFITVIIVSFIFIISSYYLSTKKDLSYLYSIGTIGGILTLAPVIITEKVFRTFDPPLVYNPIFEQISIIALALFAILNWILPFIKTPLPTSPLSGERSSSNIKNLLIGIIAGLLFIAYQIFNFGNEYFPGVVMGFAFAILAIVYFVMGYFMMNKIGLENIKKEETSKNVIYTYLGVSISVFSLAIAFIFSSYEAVISAVWLFEATILFYFFSKTKSSKIFGAAIVLFFIGVSKLMLLVDVVQSKDFIFLIPFTLIFISLVLNIKFLNFIKEGAKRVSHDILHILGIGTLAILLLEIIPSSGTGWSLLGISTFLLVIGYVYSFFSSNILKIFYVIIFTGLTLLHIGDFDSINYRLENRELEYLIILQYASTIILGVAIYLWNKFSKTPKINAFLNTIFALYLLIITSLYIYDIFEVTFAITIYWGIIASIFMFIGISKDIIKLRTIGLYLIGLTAFKIFFYDIWYGLDDAISRVAALIILGVLFIVISTQYTKRFGNNIVKELSLDNLKTPLNPPLSGGKKTSN